MRNMGRTNEEVDASCKLFKSFITHTKSLIAQTKSFITLTKSLITQTKLWTYRVLAALLAAPLSILWGLLFR